MSLKIYANAKEQGKAWRDRNRDKLRMYGLTYRTKNKARISANHLRYRELHRDGKWKSTQLKAKYGITLEEYTALLLSQGGTCAICKNPPNGKRLSVDHCHTSGKIRGLLCAGCNHALGMFRENAQAMRSAALYIEAAQ